MQNALFPGGNGSRPGASTAAAPDDDDGCCGRIFRDLGHGAGGRGRCDRRLLQSHPRVRGTGGRAVRAAGGGAAGGGDGCGGYFFLLVAVADATAAAAAAFRGAGEKHARGLPTGVSPAHVRERKREFGRHEVVGSVSLARALGSR